MTSALLVKVKGFSLQCSSVETKVGGRVVAQKTISISSMRSTCEVPPSLGLDTLDTELLLNRCSETGLQHFS